MSVRADGAPVRIGDRYRLDERVGSGAMGVVWRGTDELLNRTVAVKELLAAGAAAGADPDTVAEAGQRIMREGRIGARLQHAHVISMFDVVVHDDRPWLVMEYLPSVSLARFLADKGTMTPHEAARMGEHVADGLAAAHLAGIVHRDVKPGNVLIADDGRVKLGDFGVSRAVDDVQLTRTGLIAGTPAFLSPEVARGLAPTAASDMFALGATLYAAVEGTPPFGLDDNAFALLHKVATGEIAPPQYSGPLTPVLLALLAVDPDARPSASQARAALAAVADGRDPGLAAPGGGPSAVLSAAAAGARGPSGAGAAAGSATAGGGLGGGRPGGPPTRAAVAPVGAGSSGRPGSNRSGDGLRRRAPMLLAAAGLVVLAGAGVTAWALSGDGAVPPVAASPSTSSVPAASTPPPSTTSTPAPTTTTAPPTTTTTTTPPSSTAAPTSTVPPAGATDPVAFVQRYYGLLPGDTDSAFTLLSPAAQAQSGGQSVFDSFYGGMRSVTLENPRQTGDGQVSATVVFVKNDGTTTREPYRFVVSGGDAPVLESFNRS